MIEKKVRADKFLWSVRIYKTRSLATNACRTGRVKIGDDIIKASREIYVGDIISIRLTGHTKTIEVKEILHNRVGAKLVDTYISDLTPAEEYAKIELKNDLNQGKRDRGAGRPTKKERRQLDNLDVW